MIAKLPKTLTLIAVFLFISVSAIAQQVPFPENYDQTKISRWGHTSKGTNWDTSPYLPFIYDGIAMRLMPPNGVTYDIENDSWDFGSGEKFPIIMFFHGAGEVGTDNNNQLKHGGQTHRNAVWSDEFRGFLLYPQNAYITDMKVLLDQLVAEGYPIDQTRVYVHGLSRGAVWSWDFALAYPEVAAAIFPMSGVVQEDFTDIIYTPVRLAQGGQDRNPAPQWAFDMVDDFEAAGGQLEMFYHESFGHGTWNAQYARDDFFTWFLEQRSDKIYAKYGYSEVCPEDPIDVVLGVNPGQDGYQWSKDGEELEGQTDHELFVTEFGDYSVSVLIDGEWTIPQEVKTVGIRPATDTPPISTTGLHSVVLPDPNGNMQIPLTLPDGYETYEWFKNSVSFSSNSIISAGPGVYTALVQEKFGCSSNLSDEFTILLNSEVDVPNGPGNVAVSALSETELEVSWVDNSANETDFEVWRRLSQEDDYELIAVLSEGTESYVDQNLLAGTLYLYSIRGINENGASVLSSEVGEITLDDNIKPTAPANLSVFGTTTYSVDLTWNAATDDVGVVKYFVYQDGVKILSLKGTETTVYNLNEGSLYAFNVSAVDASGNESPLSNRVVTAAVLSGLHYKYYEGSWNELPDFDVLTPVNEGLTNNVDISVGLSNDNFGFLWEGYIKIQESGVYTFQTLSDDGSKLYIGGYDDIYEVVDNDGLHGSRYERGTHTFAEPGLYPIAITFFEKGGGQNMQVFMKKGIENNQNQIPLIPDEAFTDQFTLPDDEIYPPLNFVASGTSHGTMDLSWEDNNDNETGYQIFRSNGGSQYVSIAVLGNNVFSFQDTNLLPGTTYSYNIVSLGQYIQSAVDNTDGTTLSLPDAPPAPADFAANPLSVSSIELSWTQQTVNGYEITRSTEIDGTYVTIATLEENEVTYTDEFLSAHTEYFYSLRSFNDGGFSLSSDLSATTLNSVPTIITSIPDYLLDFEEAPMLTVNGLDAETDDLTFEGINFPAFITIGDETTSSASININPGIDDVGIYDDLGIRVTDAFGGISEITEFTVEIYVNEAPVVERLDLFSYTDIEGDIHAEIYADQSTVLSYLFTDSEGDAIVSAIVETVPGFGNFQQVNSNDGSLVLNPVAGDVGSYDIDITIEDSKGKIGSLSFILDVVILDPNQDPVVDFETVFINFTINSTYAAPAPWNNLMGDPVASHELLNLNNDEGIPTGFGITLENEWFDVKSNGAVTGDNSGQYPDMVMSTHYEDDSDTDRIIKLTGLDQTKIYDLVFFASKGGKKKVDTRVTEFAVGTHRSALISNNNTTETATLKALEPNASGEITIEVSKRSGSWQYINAMEIRYYEEPTVPFEPTNLIATAISHSEIELSWQDNSSNENGFEIYRSTSASGPWILEFTTTEDVNTYVDGNLLENTQYHYRIRSFNDLGESSYSETVGEATFIYSFYQTALVNLTTKSSLFAPSPWNNLFGSPQAGLTLNDLNSTLNVETDLSISLVNDWSGGDSYGAVTGNNSGVYPDNAMQTYFTNDTGVDREILISGCDPSKIYELSFFGSLSWGSYSLLQVTVNGTQVELLVGNNTTETVTIKKIVPDENGQIHVFANQGNSTPMYLSAIEIRYYDEPLTPLTPSGLMATAESHDVINLTWNDNSTNEDEFEIYRATDPSGPWSLVATLGENVEQYSDTGLDESTMYYYYVVATNASGASSESGFAQEQTYVYTYYDALLINFSNSIYSIAPSPWNTLVGGPPTAGLRLDDMIDSRGASTTIDIELVNAWSGSDSHGGTTGDDSGPYIDMVMGTFYEDNSASDREILISGLDPTKIVDLVFFSSRKWISNSQTTVFTVNGKQTQLVADDNLSQTASLYGLIPNGSGELLLQVNMTETTVMKYLNAMEVRYYDESLIPFTPVDLTADAFSSSGIQLTWTDKSSNETGTEIYRSLSPTGPWTLVTTTGVDVEEFTDTGLSDNTLFYYKIRSINIEGESDYTPVVNAQTYEYFAIESVLINFSNSIYSIAPSPWNTLVGGPPTAGARLDNMINSQGLSTQMDVELVNSWSGSDSHGGTTGDDSGPFIDMVMGTYYEDNSAVDRELLFSDLDPNKVYDMVLLSSRKWVSNLQTTVFKVNGKQTQLVADDNLSQTASLYGLIPNASGELLLQVNMTESTVMKYLNAIELKYYDESLIPFTPVNFAAQPFSSSTIELTWTDKSTNEEATEVYRSLSGAGPWTLVETLGSDVEAYTDNGLSDNTTYYYQIRSTNSEGESDYTPVVSAETYEYFEVESVLVNFSNSIYSIAPAPWNTLIGGPPTAGLSMENMTNSQGFVTQMDLELVNTWSSSDSHGATTGDDSGPFIDIVMSTYYEDNSSTDREILLSDLDSDKVYDLVFFSSRKWVNDSRTTVFTVNGVHAQLIADDNTSETATLVGVKPNASGDLLIQVNMTAGTVMKYLNALEIRSYDEPLIPYAAANLNANAISSSSITLAWEDKSTNEDGFRVYVSTVSSDGPWNLITTLSPGVENYQIDGLSQNTLYYYQIGAFNENGESLSNVSEQSTYIFKAYVNFNAVNNEGAPWNNFDRIPDIGETLSNVLNSQGNPTGIDVTLGDGWTGDFAGGYIAGDGIYPDNVLLTYFYVEAPNEAELILSGLNFTHSFDLTFLGSWVLASNTSYKNGNQIVSQDVLENDSETVTLYDLRPDENGEIKITIFGSPYAIVNAMEINVTGGNNIPAAVARRLAEMELAQAQAEEENLNIAPSVSFYPNPATDRLSLDLWDVDSSENITVEVLDVQGRRVLFEQNRASELKQLDLHDVRQGMYLVRIQIKDHVFVDRLIIRK